MGIFGIAVSSAIFSSAFPNQALYEFQKTLQVNLENNSNVVNNS
jgi:thiamine monophosphate synthase